MTLMLVAAGQEPTKIATALLLHALADANYACKVLIGELGGFHALTEMIQLGLPMQEELVSRHCVS